MVDQLLEDVMALRAEPAPTRWPTLVAQSQVLSGLPARFWHRITPVVAAKFLVVAVDLTSRVSRGWAPPSCVAEELMLPCLLDEVADLAETDEVDQDEEWRPLLEDALFEDLDHEMLDDPAVDGFEDDPSFMAPPGMAPMGFRLWFVPPSTKNVGYRRTPRTVHRRRPDGPSGTTPPNITAPKVNRRSTLPSAAPGPRGVAATLRNNRQLPRGRVDLLQLGWERPYGAPERALTSRARVEVPWNQCS